MLKIKNLSKSFGTHQVLKDVNLQINKGDVVAVIGPSGAGKTTLLRCLNFLETSDSGTITFDGEDFDFTKIHKSQIINLRKKTSFVFQDFNLFLNKTALQNITEGLIVAQKIKKAQAQEVAHNLLTKVGLKEKGENFPHQLSGGQQQRVAIARALATQPKIIFFDEPTSALDPKLTSEVLDVIKKLANEGLTMIVVTHEMEFAKTVANKIVFMADGQIVETSIAKDFFENPKTERAKLFLGIK